MGQTAGVASTGVAIGVVAVVQPYQSQQQQQQQQQQRCCVQLESHAIVRAAFLALRFEHRCQLSEVVAVVDSVAGLGQRNCCCCRRDGIGGPERHRYAYTQSQHCVRNHSLQQ